MEQSFSQRMGFKSVKTVLQIDSMDEELRVALWNVVTDVIQNFLLAPIEEPGDYNKSWRARQFTRNIWVNFLKKTSDTFPDIYSGSAVKIYFKQIKVYFFKFEWYEVYDFLDFLANTCPDRNYTKMYVQECNAVLAKEMSAYRFNGKKLAPITSPHEISEIEEALSVSHKFTQHLDRALELMANRKEPDYRNSIKESISAVEAMCKLITGSPKVTLGDALRQIESKLGTLHPALRNAFNSLYGYTSDAEGIRHGMLGESSLDVEDAKFMLITCSAFINYLNAKAKKAGIKLRHK